jgi:triosephosphate isomerase
MKKIVIANWKMNLGIKESQDLTKKILSGLKKIENLENIEIVISPSFVALPFIKEIIKNFSPPVYLGAQNIFWEEKGSYTGEISPLFLKELGVNFAIIGHSERRINLKEDDEMVHKKVRIALHHQIVPIICIGETFEEREENQTDLILIKQISFALEGFRLTEENKIVIAYEPVWAIGSGQAVEPQQLQHAKFIIKQRLVDLFGFDLVDKCFRIIYGGSVDSKNVKRFVEKKIDGFLIGGSSLNAEEFLKIIEIVSKNF